jgi:hypothetical protein
VKTFAALSMLVVVLEFLCRAFEVQRTFPLPYWLYAIGAGVVFINFLLFVFECEVREK